MNSTNLETFFGDLRAAIRAGIHLEIGSDAAPNKLLGLKDLERLQNTAVDSEQHSPRFRAAMETWQTTGTMIPILEGLSTRRRAWTRVNRLFRHSLMYVIVLAVLAIVALIHYQLNILPEIEAVRTDLMTISRPSKPLGPSAAGFWAKIALGFFVALLSVVIWWAVKGRIGNKDWIGIDSYVRSQTMATAARAMQLLVAEGVEPVKAAGLGGDLAGLDAEGKGELLYMIKERDERAILAPAWIDYLLMIADQQYVSVRTWGPASIVVFFGGVFVFIFVLLAYGPIASLIFDLSYNTQV